MPKEPKWIAFCCLAILLALYVAGTLRHGVVRNVLQTLPLWVPISLGLRGSEFAKWSALPCLIIWLAAMMIVWLFLFRWTNIQWWHFSPAEIAMTFIVGLASAAGFLDVSPPTEYALTRRTQAGSPVVGSLTKIGTDKRACVH